MKLKNPKISVLNILPAKTTWYEDISYRSQWEEESCPLHHCPRPQQAKGGKFRSTMLTSWDLDLPASQS